MYTLYDNVFANGVILTASELVERLTRCLDREELSPELRVEPTQRATKTELAELRTEVLKLREENTMLKEKLNRKGRAGRKPLGKQAATGTERARKSRAKKKA